MLRHIAIAFILALGFTGVPASAVEGKDRCGCQSCQCVDCDPGCRCCTVPTSGVAQNPNQKFAPSKTPVYSNIRAWADLPVEQHKRNTGGIGRGGPGTGAGLCVYTSAWHAAMWQNIPEIYPFRNWMMNKEGGSWPEKFDRTIKQFCQEKGVPVPAYVQHTGGDMDFLKAALKSGRMPCVTYAGYDDFYPRKIAHMVNLMHLDGGRACIMDNNRPGVFLWMSEADFRQRWLDMSGGWAFVFLAPPPMVYDTLPVQEFLAAPVERAPDSWFANVLPPATPEPPVGEAMKYETGADRAKELDVPLVTFVGRPAKAVHGCVVAYAPTLDGFPQGSIVVSQWVDGQHLGVVAGLNNLGGVDVDTALAKLNPKNKDKIANFGVDFSKIDRERRYSLNGEECSQKRAFEAFTQTPDDANKVNLAFVGDRIEAMRATWDRVPAELRAKINVQFYPPDDWAVRQFNLRPGATLREADGPQIDRVGKEIGFIPMADLTLEDLIKLLDNYFNPKPPVPPVPVPDPSNPDTPNPTPHPVVPPAVSPCVIALAILIYILYRQYRSK